MPKNKLVVHFTDGHVLKGHSMDFNPNRSSFHLAAEKNPDITAEIDMADLKAVFFVRDFRGDPTHTVRNEFDPDRSYIGKKLLVEFKDGERLAGVRQGYRPGRPGFFLTPADPDCNTERAFIVKDAVKSVEEV